ncbi:outer membrane beta-barrel protein [Nibribacter ruber]|uniref:Outer membrane beta-barrel protein n=1 Tax=Nibribacter ruber TaxID=2698458 RepID=A0A6P1NVW0_9BACT|nr:outer membrane beta-barrel protein [Nibribacter ruber]QHL86399.1 outer membrane beta-barrel protein [Nibribacter ruber]
MKRMYALLPAIMMAAAIALPSRAESKVALQPAAQDTLIMKLKNNSQVLVVVKDLKDLKSIKNMNLDSLVSLLDKHTTEIERAGAAANEKPVTITVDGDSGNGTEEINITISQDSKEGRQVIKKEIKNVKIDVSVDGDEDESTLKVNVGKDDDDDDDDDEKEKPRNPKHGYDFQIDLGVSTWANKEMLPGSGESVQLRTFGSRYVSLNSKWMNRLGNENSPLRLHTGITLDFHNYMFDDNTMMVNNGERVAFVRPNDMSLDKSKLATSTLTIPVELGLDFRDNRGKSNFRIGAGGFVGYMVGSHTKLKYSQDGDTEKTKVKDDFYLNDFQYGLSGFIGIRSLEFFAKYNLSELFEDGKGPQANALAVGIRIMKF